MFSTDRPFTLPTLSRKRFSAPAGEYCSDVTMKLAPLIIIFIVHLCLGDKARFTTQIVIPENIYDVAEASRIYAALQSIVGDSNVAQIVSHKWKTPGIV